MLSKVLPKAEGEAQPVAWRNSSSAVARTRLSPTSRTASSWTSVPPVTPSAVTPPPVTPEAELEAQVHQQLQVAFESGYREGENTAKQNMEGEVRRAVEQLAQAAVSVADARNETIHRAEADILRLSMEIARRILHRELSVDSAALAALIRAALDKLATQQVFHVRVHPDQAQMVQASLAQLGRTNVEVISDTTQPRGGALFEAEGGTLDASVETQLQEIERGFADRLQERT